MQNKCINSSNCSRVDGIVLGIKVAVDNCWEEDVDHSRHVVFQHADDFRQRFQSVQVDLAVGLQQPVLKGIKHLNEKNTEQVKKSDQSELNSFGSAAETKPGLTGKMVLMTMLGLC